MKDYFDDKGLMIKADMQTLKKYGEDIEKEASTRKVTLYIHWLNIKN